MRLGSYDLQNARSRIPVLVLGWCSASLEACRPRDWGELCVTRFVLSAACAVGDDGQKARSTTTWDIPSIIRALLGGAHLSL